MRKLGVCANFISDNYRRQITQAAEALGFDPVRDQLITYVSDSEGYTIGTFQRYTTQDLVELGKALVGESELSEETKSLYGIS